MRCRGFSWLLLLSALTLAALLTSSWLSLWQQHQFMQQVQQWRLHLLQLQQAQRNYYQQQGQFADSQQQLVQQGLLAAPLAFPFATDWQFDARQHTLLMRSSLNTGSVTLLLKGFNNYLWQPPQLTVKVIGYEQF
ncbi:hypothetical protein LG288_03870 [Idiomarina seosinensis]|uniref:hypothetical protein n=1 Tax=Idiomarina seosinensis TaxID=281739 RepID=UPI00384EFF4F